MKRRKIAILGRARTGKSFLVSMFSKDSKKYRDFFCREGRDKTACPVYNYFYKGEGKNPHISFYSNFESVHSRQKDEQKEEILKDWLKIREKEVLEEEVEVVGKHSFTMDPYVDETIDYLKRIEQLVRKMKKYETDHGFEESESHFEVYFEASDLCYKFLNDEGVLEVVDTPGVSGKVGSKVMKADLYIFVLRSDNSEEAETIYKIVKELKPYIAGAKVCFLYQGCERPDNEEEYEQQTLKSREAMQDFEGYFDGLKGSIISTSIDALYPASHSLLFPSMKYNVPSKSEDMFKERLGEKLEQVFFEDKKSDILKIQETVSEKEEAKDFIRKILREIPAHQLDESGKEYTLDDFKEERHGRTKTDDGYRLLNTMMNAYKREKEYIYDYFEQFSSEKFVDWQADMIKRIFVVLEMHIDMDGGIYLSNHWKETPQTMNIEEGILSEEIYNNIDQLIIGSPEKLFGDFGIHGSWRFVERDMKSEFNDKIILVKNTLVERPVFSLEDMILYRYLIGFRVFAMNKILKAIGMDEKERIDFLKEINY